MDSKYCYVYFVKEKNSKQFYADIQMDEHNVKRLRIDYDKEFCNSAVKNYSLSKNNKYETTTACRIKCIYREIE